MTMIDGGTGLRQRDGLRAGRQLNPLQLEFPERRPEEFLAQHRGLGGEHGHADGLERDGVQQFRHVHELRREPAAEHVVRGRHDLDAEAVQVGMDVAGRQVHGLARRQRDPVQQQRNQHARVAGVVAR